MTTKSGRIISKLKKLLAMSQDKSSENEAMIAAKQLHSLLAKHNISMAELGNDDEQEPIDQDHMVQKCRPWKRVIAYNVAKLYFCQMYFMRTGKGKSQYVFVGTDSNRTFAMYITSMIIQTLEKQARRECKEVYGQEVPAFVNSFWTAASTRISERCNQLIDSAKAGTLEDEQGNTLPVLASIYDQTHSEISSWLESQGTKLKATSANMRSNNAAGNSRGAKAGDSVQLSRAIQGKAAPKQIGAM